MNTNPEPELAESWLELPDGRQHWLSGQHTIGRHIENAVMLDNPSVSRRHALVSGTAGKYSVSDLHSSNGTYVNQVPVTRPTPLRDGDEIRFGDVVVRYRSKRPPPADPSVTINACTRRIDDVRERACWLMLADVIGFSGLNANLGSKAALQLFHLWIGGMRPLIERHGGHINSYLGDAIFAWWPAEPTATAQVRAALDAITAWRGSSPVPFRVVVHHGSALFTRSEHGEELSGHEVNFVFRAEKLAKKFGATAMLSANAVQALGLADRCTKVGTSAVEGISGEFTFFALISESANPATRL